MDTALIGIIVGIVAMMLMVIKTRIPVALAMVIASIIMGLFAGMAPKALIDAITRRLWRCVRWHRINHCFWRDHGRVF